MLYIRRFDEITVKPRMLILCDIDDTVLDYGDEMENYWKSNIHDPGFEIWNSIVTRTIPRLTDYEIHTFFQEALKKECDIHFITHRGIHFTDITYKHLSDFGISGIPVHFVSGASKSQYINRTFHLKEYNGIIFIDDKQHNVKDVMENVEVACEIYTFMK